jgi:hypothetical protein
MESISSGYKTRSAAAIRLDPASRMMFSSPLQGARRRREGRRCCDVSLVGRSFAGFLIGAQREFCRA